jgi:hypothetical protein
MGDNMHPANRFERHKQFALISRHFYYFGRKAIYIPKSKFRRLEKKGPGFKVHFNETYIARFLKWLKTETKNKWGKHGDPCMKTIEDASKRKRSETCKLSC